MPLANPNGPKWSRPLVVQTEKRLWGLNPVRWLFASLFRRRRTKVAAATQQRRFPDDGPAGAGVTAPLVPTGPTLAGANALELPAP